MISVVVLFYSKTLKSMLVDYAVIEMGCFDDYSGAVPRAKTMRGNSITTFLLHVATVSLTVKKNCYSNTYCRGVIEVILFKFRFQFY